MPDTIAFARAAGIKVWVLTGDKTGTAINIGYSCRLLEHNGRMDVHKIETVEKTATLNIFKDLLNLINEGTYDRMKQDRELAVVVTGQCLTVIAEDKELNLQFLEITSHAKVVIACRVSPK